MHKFKFLRSNVWGQELLLSIDDLDWFDFERFTTVFREGPNECVEANISFWPVESSDFNEYVFCID